MRIRNLFREVLEDVRRGRNIDVYIAIILNAVLAILGILEVVPGSIFVGVILASLSWLSLNVLLERKEGSEKHSELLQEIRDQGNSVKLFSDSGSFWHFRRFSDACVKFPGPERLFLSFQMPRTGF